VFTATKGVTWLRVMTGGHSFPFAGDTKKRVFNFAIAARLVYLLIAFNAIYLNTFLKDYDSRQCSSILRKPSPSNNSKLPAIRNRDDNQYYCPTAEVSNAQEVVCKDVVAVHRNEHGAFVCDPTRVPSLPEDPFVQTCWCKYDSAGPQLDRGETDSADPVFWAQYVSSLVVSISIVLLFSPSWVDLSVKCFMVLCLIDPILALSIFGRFTERYVETETFPP
jgi:hypothetical protein